MTESNTKQQNAAFHDKHMFNEAKEAKSFG